MIEFLKKFYSAFICVSYTRPYTTIFFQGHASDVMLKRLCQKIQLKKPTHPPWTTPLIKSLNVNLNQEY